VSAVPEPGDGAMLGVGMTMLVCWRRKRAGQ
jgi:hypothetical protein